MSNIEKIDNQLYMVMYGKPNSGELTKLWKEIKNNNEILKEAIKLTKNKYNEDTLVGTVICDCILIDYSSVDKEIYKELIDTIYSNQRIARIVLDGYSNGGFSFLLMTLWNHNLKLTEEQKAFAVSEAMNKIGTTKYLKHKEEYSKKLDEQGITNDMTTIISYGKEANPIGAKAGCEYMNFMFYGMSDTQAHGTGAFDIRYYILRNPNWTIKEKRKLIYDFYYDDEIYDEYLDAWEWNIINYSLRDNENPIDLFNLPCNFNYEDLLELTQDKKKANKIWSEVLFCRKMKRLRKPSWEKDSHSVHQLRKKNRELI